MVRRVISLPAIGKSVPLGAYVGVQDRINAGIPYSVRGLA